MNVNTAKNELENPPESGAGTTLWSLAILFAVVLVVGFVL